MSDNYYVMQAELIKIETKLIKMAVKYKDYNNKMYEIVDFIEEKRIEIEKEEKNI